VETQMVRHKPEGLDALCQLTKFTRKELQIMYRGFKQVGLRYVASQHTPAISLTAHCRILNHFTI